MFPKLDHELINLSVKLPFSIVVLSSGLMVFDITTLPPMLSMPPLYKKNEG